MGKGWMLLAQRQIREWLLPWHRVPASLCPHSSFILLSARFIILKRISEPALKPEAVYCIAIFNWKRGNRIRQRKKNLWNKERREGEGKGRAVPVVVLLYPGLWWKLWVSFSCHIKKTHPSETELCEVPADWQRGDTFHCAGQHS